MAKLTAKTVANLSKTGRHGDGGGLYLAVTPAGAKRWTFRYRRNGKRHEIGLGSAAPGAVSLAEAREKASECRRMLRDGFDPLVRRTARAAVPLFVDFANEWMGAQAGRWKNPKHTAQWSYSLVTLCRPLHARLINEITTEDVLNVLTPLWQKVPETASRLRGRIEAVLDAAKARGFRDGENPARWRGHLKSLLPPRHRLTRGHHAAMAYASVPTFMRELRAYEGFAARALELTILTAARSGEILNATWTEIDLNNGLWTIPAQRMKAGRDHRVPLSEAAVELLRGLPRLESNAHVFPGLKHGKPLSSTTMAKVLERMNLNCTTHGFRAAFRTWAGERTHSPREVIEQSLAHIVGDMAERAYIRSDLFDKRRSLMEAWAAFCDGPASAKVVSIGAVR